MNIPVGQPCRVMEIEYFPKPPHRSGMDQFEEIGVVDCGNAQYPSLRILTSRCSDWPKATGRSVRPDDRGGLRAGLRHAIADVKRTGIRLS